MRNNLSHELASNRYYHHRIVNERSQRGSFQEGESCEHSQALRVDTVVVGISGVHRPHQKSYGHDRGDEGAYVRNLS